MTNYDMNVVVKVLNVVCWLIRHEPVVQTPAKTFRIKENMEKIILSPSHVFNYSTTTT